ncbi:uncharacterized protein V6R79_021922 [Siganus canaliculatus]
MPQDPGMLSPTPLPSPPISSPLLSSSPNILQDDASKNVSFSDERVDERRRAKTSEDERRRRPPPDTLKEL